ncbi:hypothetical protein FKG94_09125 [Exilibacterium tricleocarpae]|uniref:Uncharacterized protein n=1 Tax=Exilibacterium tricleocarpae TaxID=2591008 RepID=A0A545TVL5_9GAMM|nr:hypothetical protein [Exilibacterium tricleocarpae]TQV81253.1 hypothetical protein FKG94_09125 [Exilibacterium tricleocarpae]
MNKAQLEHILLSAAKVGGGRAVTGYCLEVHGLAVAKYAAGREKDHIFLAVMINKGMLRKKELMNRVCKTKCIQLQCIIDRIKRDFKKYASKHHDFGKYVPSSAQVLPSKTDITKQQFIAAVKERKNII